MKKIVLLAVSLAFIASIGVGGTLAFRTYLITNHTITNSATVAPASADKSPAPFALQVSNGGTLADFNVRAKGVQALDVDNEETGEGTPTGPSITITQNTYRRKSDGTLDPVNSSIDSEGNTTRTILTQLLPSPAFQKANPLPDTDDNGYWNNVGAVDHIVDVSYSYTGADDAPAAYVRTIFAFPNPVIDSSTKTSFMDNIYLNWQDESNLTEYNGKKYTDFNIDDLPYRVYVYTYPTVSSGSETAPSLLQVAMDASITNADINKLDPYNGFAVKIVSQAITADADDTAKAAVFYEVSETKNPWKTN